jgi:hypothetical protein
MLPASGWSQTTGQPANSPETVKVFLSGAAAQPYATEIPFATIVAARAEADVVLEIVPGDESGRTLLKILVTGQGRCAGKRDELVYRPAEGENPEATRKGVSGLLQLGLVRFMTETAAAACIDILFQDQVKPTAVVDPWNFWVFSLSANGFLSGEKSYRSESWYLSASANRVTPEWKVRMGLSVNLDKSVYDYAGYQYESESRSNRASALIVKSLGEHWSIGAAVSVGSSTFTNQDFALAVTPALEFDVFPYSESTQKQLCFLYSVGPAHYRYTEETIFDKKRETRWRESLSVALDLKRPWGTMSVSLEGSHYFHDFSKNRLELNAEISWRILKGLNFNIDGGGARVRDQLALAKGGASIEEVLLRRRQLATGYDYYFSVGLSYTFGSVLSNIVNPRFNSGDGTSISIHM